MSESLLQLVLRGEELPEAYNRYKTQWEIDSEGKTLFEYLGIDESELKEIEDKRHSFRFICYRKYHKKNLLNRVFPGVYIQFATEYDSGRFFMEYGWVDSFNKESNVVSIQCDDCYFGNRSLEIDIVDVMQILPTKERPNIFYKAMLCKDCKDCSRESGEFNSDCPFFGLFSKIKENRIESKTRIGEYLGYEKHGEKTPRTQE